MNVYILHVRIADALLDDNDSKRVSVQELIRRGLKTDATGNPVECRSVQTVKHWLTHVLPVAVLLDTALSVGYKPHGRGCSSWFGQDCTKDERKEVRPALTHTLPDTLNPILFLTTCTRLLRWRTSSLQRCNRGCQWRSWIRKAYRHLCMCGATTSYGRVSRCGAYSVRSHWTPLAAHGYIRARTRALSLSAGQSRSLEMHATDGKPLDP